MAGAQRVYEGLFKLAQQTGVAVSESAGSFSRFAVAAKEIGATNDQVLRLVSGIQKAGIVAGTSAEEAGAAVMQLAQALASGVLQGDELRSLLENMPQLAQALAKELGTNIGQLRQMGAEGKLTADKVFPALLAASEKMNAEFEKMPPTMGRAFGILGTAMEDFAGRLDRALGLSQAIAAAAIKAANAVNAVKNAIVPDSEQRAYNDLAAGRANLANIQRQMNAITDPSVAGIGQLTSSEDRQRDLQRLRDQYAAEQIVVRDAEERLTMIETAARDQRLLEQQKADAKRVASEAEAAAKGRKALMADYDERYKIATKYQEDVKKIEENFAKGGLTSSERDLLLHNLATKMEADLKKVDEAAKTATESVKGLMEIWSNPQLNFKTGLLSLSEGDNRFQDQVKKNLEKATEEQKKRDAETRKDAEREAEKTTARNQKITDDIVQYSAERFGDLFSKTGRGWAGLMDSMKTTAIATFGRIASEALLRPIIQPIVGAVLGGGSGTSGGMGSLLQLGGLGNGLSSLLGNDWLGPVGSTTANGWSVVSNGGILDNLGIGNLLGNGSGFLGLESGLTGGQLFGGIGLGVGLGSLANGLVGGNTLGGGIGSLLGTLALGPLGGIAGGLLGGLFGPGQAHHGYAWTLGSANGNGGTPADQISFVGKSNVDPVAQQQFAQEQQQIAAFNVWMRQQGLNVWGRYIVGGNNDPNLEKDAASWGAGFGALGFGANDNRLNTALALHNSATFASPDELQSFVTGFQQFIGAFDSLAKAPLGEYAAAVKSLNDTYDAAIAKAKEYALAEGDLTAERDRRAVELQAQRDRQARGITAGLTVRYDRAKGLNEDADLLAFDTAADAERIALKQQIDALGLTGTQYAAERIVQIEQTLAAERLAIVERYAADSRAAGQSLLVGLTIGSGSALPKEQQYFAGLSLLNQARRDLDAGGTLADYASVVSQVLPVARDYLGTSERYAGLVADISGVVTSKGGDPAGLGALLQAQSDDSSALRNVFAAYGEKQVQVATATLTELRRMTSTLEALIARQTAA